MNENDIQIYNNKDIKLFNENCVNKAVKTGWYINKLKRYDLILKVTVSSIKSCFFVVTFSNSHLIISINKIQLGEMLDPA